MLRWAEGNGINIPSMATAVDCSESHLRNIFAGRKEASLPLAKRLSDLTGGIVPMDAFLRPAAFSEANAEARPSAALLLGRRSP